MAEPIHIVSFALRAEAFPQKSPIRKTPVIGGQTWAITNWMAGKMFSYKSSSGTSAMPTRKDVNAASRPMITIRRSGVSGRKRFQRS